ncbi:hypothetical protein [Alkalihalobacillus deserti]|uniref:hypothetical protein n=1 Tax=Alkalihalobacillus deserti TaxID=2879466 RepID=UPI001D15D617|nr:hypothetical protein [Alkalihalobacillus deserti]
MAKNGYIRSVLFGGILGATGVLVMTTERGKTWRKEFIDKVSQLDGSNIANLLSETSKDWSEFGDVIKVKTRSTKKMRP